MRLNDLTGEQFGALMVVRRATNDDIGKVRWECKCTCGRTKIVRAQALTTGATKTCGECAGVGVLGNVADLTPKYHVVAIDGPQLGVMRTAYGFCHVTRADTGDVLFTAQPIARQFAKGEPSAAASRALSWLVQAELIQPRAGRTWMKWTRDERVSVRVAESNDKADVIRQWEALTGLVHESNLPTPLNPLQGARPPLPQPDRPHDTDAMLGVLHHMLTDDTTPTMDEATQRENQLADVRRGGGTALDIARQTVDRSKH